MTRTRFAVAAAVATLTMAILAVPTAALAAPTIPVPTAGSPATITDPVADLGDISWGG